MRLGDKCHDKDSFYYNPAVLIESYPILKGRRGKLSDGESLMLKCRLKLLKQHTFVPQEVL